MYLHFIERMNIDSCIGAAGFRQNCDECGDIFLTFRVSIDSAGKPTGVENTLKEIDCIAPKSEDDKRKVERMIHEKISRAVFPVFLRRSVISMRLGRATRC